MNMRAFVRLAVEHEPHKSYVDNSFSPAIGLFGTLHYLGADVKSVNKKLHPGPALIRLTEPFESTDPRDRIFALQGLIKTVNLLPPIDYSSTLGEIMKDIVQFAIEEDGSLAILDKNHRSLQKPIVSWYPVTSVAPTSAQWSSSGQWQASGTFTAKSPWFSHSDTVLHVRGVVLGTVKHIIGPFLSTRDMSNSEWPDYWAGMTSSIRDYWHTLSAQRQNGMWRTLILDHVFRIPPTATEAPAPATLRRPFLKVFIDPSTRLAHEFEADASPSDKIDDSLIELLSQMRMTMPYNCFLEIDSDDMGMGPQLTQPGDIVTLLLGGDMFYVLRPRGKHYQLVGSAWVNGLMNGELMEKGLDNIQDFGIC
jgi:hypothetical protein